MGSLLVSDARLFSDSSGVSLGLAWLGVGGASYAGSSSR